MLSVLVQQARKSLLHDKELEEKFCCNIVCIIKVKYNLDIFCTGLASKFGIIGIFTCHQASICLLRTAAQ